MNDGEPSFEMVLVQVEEFVEPLAPERIQPTSPDKGLALFAVEAIESPVNYWQGIDLAR
ncbi:hypothetical protein [Mesorhizobium sp. LCM 4576]|uniref:hypothetical protein n=1 Tax=Mesorhizobium sp. LCM 4576 TaxID=1848289 RepID=UPI0012FFABC0|nr:hypothetical protein [Mesorhizobium sp. LCM 4576]